MKAGDTSIGLHLKDIVKDFDRSADAPFLICSSFSDKIYKKPEGWNTMETITITGKIMADFEAWLRAEEKSEGTREKYLRDLRAFPVWLGGREPAKETAAKWKEYLFG